jgi:membrane protease YdiL (CAAX protease family)
LASTAVLVPALLGIAKLKRDAQLRSYFALRPVRASVLAGWIGVTLAFLAISDGLTLLLGKPIVPEFIRLAYATAQPVWPLWLALVVAAPLFEEALFRGFLFTGFQASALGSAGTIIVTSLLWAAIHLQYDLYGIATIFAMGVVFGVARVATRSIYVPIALHATANLIATLEAAWLA